MCGIVGYIGNQNAVPILVDGLKKLEYRGYDSAGVAVCGGGAIDIRKYKGRLSVLEQRLNEAPLSGTLGIGHTRWATHGEPSDQNAHPHAGGTGDIAVVHNGIIENYQQIKNELTALGYEFRSETDTEVLAHYIDHFYEGDLAEAVRKVLGKIRGSYAFAVVSGKEPDKIVCVRKENPLIVGVGQGENFAASDIPAILEHTRDIYLLDENELAVIRKDSVRFYDLAGNALEKKLLKVDWDAAAAEKGNYAHFMLKEIHEQPGAVRNTMTGRVSEEAAGVTLDRISLTREDLARIGRICIVACGTAYHAGLVGQYVIENLAGLPVDVKVASEFRYNCPLVDDRTLLLVVCQSGETLDTLMSLKEARKKGARILSIVNVIGSSVARESHDVLYTRAGPEIAVASTKAYTAQLIALYEVALQLAALRETMSMPEIEEFKQQMLGLPARIEEALKLSEPLRLFAGEHAQVRDLFFLGRGLDYAVALEGSLKLKELSYIHSEAYPAGELKHGPIALIEKGTVVLALLTQETLYEKMVSNIREVKARGAYVLAIAAEGAPAVDTAADATLRLPAVPALLAPVVAAVPLQLLAYHIAVARGNDVDKPRNLAKSVTVE
ncbi:glucosamine--fructose-6-phosphate aminotransferase (isomerizing) [Sporobacter termitidis DSM 10068]|uniref:Glutamine--fructose-6-phosphate aminotransferase [isomerizing] n=1 Tax=Sporobacter termitidis DSM 10068 TaxID=1123282 RepID=A0A1M5YF98_9FIRM|nr:glutamine--fructose-6-phosphate transaminase (isomerizing) [Sporobacter termitidis]SHI10707.1 glucosamine--fructose-6-phosphate aminotransferase (isomerizing) [Sporobacter termitidis DSM 10068]